ncbi:hypothetical protein NXS19_010761 [Fusarium pseudograminearum]|nr:hypothetical protein NXS19_010761 [Fusarium pseudograminearum]
MSAMETESWLLWMVDYWTRHCRNAGVLCISCLHLIGLLAAAMAATILETTGTRLSDLASLSMSRAFVGSASPWEIFMIACHRTSHQKKAVLSHWLIPLLSFVVGLGMTLTSTILLFDFKLVQIAAPSTTRSIALGIDVHQIMADTSGTSYWQSKPQAHWRFAETRPSATVNDTALEHVSDTGDIYLAPLPFDNVDDRTSLEYYDGPAIVTNSRTACVAPDLKNATFEYIRPSSRVTEGLYLLAEIDTSTSWGRAPGSTAVKWLGFHVGSITIGIRGQRTGLCRSAASPILTSVPSIRAYRTRYPVVPMHSNQSFF